MNYNTPLNSKFPFCVLLNFLLGRGDRGEMGQGRNGTLLISHLIIDQSQPSSLFHAESVSVCVSLLSFPEFMSIKLVIAKNFFLAF